MKLPEEAVHMIEGAVRGGGYGESNAAGYADVFPAGSLPEQSEGPARSAAVRAPAHVGDRAASRDRVGSSQRSLTLAVHLGHATVAALVASALAVTGERRFALLTLGWLALQLSPGPGRAGTFVPLTVRESLRRSMTLGFLALTVEALAGKTAGMRPGIAVVVVLGLLGAWVPAAVRWRPIRTRLAPDMTRQVLVVAGAYQACATAIGRMRSDPGTRVVAVCLTSNGDMLESIAGVPVVGDASSIAQLAQQLRVTSVAVLPGAALTPEDFMRLQWALEDTGIQLCLVMPLVDTSPHRLVPSVDGGQLAFLLSTRRPTALAVQVKGLVERVLATILLALTGPLIVACMLAVRLETSGAALFRQARVGESGRIFTMYKVRTMAVGADTAKHALTDCNEADGYLFKIKRDPRVTRVGKVLRTLSVDELPQLLNVVRGEMSLVGPRPALPEEVANYDDRAHRRLAVKPGITGLWQVSGRSNLSGGESIRLDIKYVDNWTPGLDAKIALSTFRAVVSRDGAY